MKKRILYIILGVLLLSLKGLSQVIINSGYSTTYNGFPKQPGYTVSGCCNEVKTFIDNSTGNSVVNAINAGSYKFRVTFTSGPDNGFFDEKDFTIIKATPTLSVTNPTLTYTASTQSATVSSSVPGSRTNVKYNGSTIAPINAGTYTITADFVPTDGSNYNSLTGEIAGNFIINKAPITISDIVLTKIYDGTPNVNVISNSSSGSLSGDNVVITGNATSFSNKIVANNYSSTVTFSLTTIPSTGKENNYYITGINPILITNGSITKLPITLTANTNTKVYDGTVSATATPTITAGALVSGDVGTYSETYDTKSQGINKVLTPSVISILDAANTSMAGNYSITYQTNTNGIITKIPITLTASTNTKVYDGTVSATATPTITNGALVSGDVGVYSEVYDTKSQGISKVLTPSVISILDATNASMTGNYSITYTNINTGVITKLPITLTATVNTKVYDGTISATATPILTGILASGDVGVYSETYDTKSQGTNKTLTPTGAILDATNASMTGNYSITYANINTGVITKLPITLTAITNTKVYDGTVSATATPTLTGILVSGDVGTYSETYDTKTQGTNKTLTPTGAILDATNVSMTGNYSITYTNINTGVISELPITFTATATDKVYDANKTASVSISSNKLDSDAVVITKTLAEFDTKDVGAGKTVNVTGITISGADAGNYTLTSSTAAGTASITAVGLTVTATASDKVYDGNKTASVSLSSNKISSDVVAITKTLAEFDTKNIGTGKTVNVTGITISGTDASNYTLTSSTASGTASITAKLLTIIARSHTIIYKGTAYTGGNGLVLVGLASGESISNLTGTLNYTGSSQGAKDIGSYTIIPGGLSSPNYNIVYVGDNLEIKKATLKVIAGDQSVNFGTPAAKILTDATFTYASLLGGDNASAITGSISYSTNYTPLTSTGSAGIYIEPIISGLSAVNYDLIAEKGNITITAPLSSPVFQIPNAFTPNSDGHNDTFKIIENGYVTSIIGFKIFTKSGKLIFSDKDGAWDGRYAGVMLDSDVYIWIADFMNKNNIQEHLSGTVLLLK